LGDYYATQTIIKALVHDGHEAYTGDIPSPIKKIPELNATLKLIEGRLDGAIYSALNLEDTSEDEKILIKHCDKLAQAIEGYQFMPSRGLNWNLPKTTLIKLQKFPQPLSPLESYKAFIARFEYLTEQ
jgi:5'-deoxynucleotidase YfbR-like HD superfamily hydrolase